MPVQKKSGNLLNIPRIFEHFPLYFDSTSLFNNMISLGSVSSSSRCAASMDFSDSLSLAICPNHPSFPVGLLENILCPYRNVASRPPLANPLESVTHEFVLSSPAVSWVSFWFYLDGFRSGGKWSYSYYFLRYYLQDLFSIARSIPVEFLSSFFSIHFVSVHVVHPDTRIDTIAVWKKSRFIHRIAQTSIRSIPYQ